MFRTNLVMHHVKGRNPYGLVNEEGSPCTRNDTIEFFKSINMEEAELILLNEYIRKDRYSHTFYDDYWDQVDQQGHPCNYIDGMRLAVEEAAEWIQMMEKMYHSVNR